MTPEEVFFKSLAPAQEVLRNRLAEMEASRTRAAQEEEQIRLEERRRARDLQDASRVRGQALEDAKRNRGHDVTDLDRKRDEAIAAAVAANTRAVTAADVANQREVDAAKIANTRAVDAATTYSDRIDERAKKKRGWDTEDKDKIRSQSLDDKKTEAQLEAIKAGVPLTLSEMSGMDLGAIVKATSEIADVDYLKSFVDVLKQVHPPISPAEIGAIERGELDGQKARQLRAKYTDHIQFHLKERKDEMVKNSETGQSAQAQYNSIFEELAKGDGADLTGLMMETANQDPNQHKFAALALIEREPDIAKILDTEEKRNLFVNHPSTFTSSDGRAAVQLSTPEALIIADKFRGMFEDQQALKQAGLEDDYITAMTAKLYSDAAGRDTQIREKGEFLRGTLTSLRTRFPWIIYTGSEYDMEGGRKQPLGQGSGLQSRGVTPTQPPGVSGSFRGLGDAALGGATERQAASPSAVPGIRTITAPEKGITPMEPGDAGFIQHFADRPLPSGMQMDERQVIASVLGDRALQMTPEEARQATSAELNSAIAKLHGQIKNAQTGQRDETVYSTTPSYPAWQSGGVGVGVPAYNPYGTFSTSRVPLSIGASETLQGQLPTLQSELEKNQNILKAFQNAPLKAPVPNP